MERVGLNRRTSANKMALKDRSEKDRSIVLPAATQPSGTTKHRAARLRGTADNMADVVTALDRRRLRRRRDALRRVKGRAKKGLTARQIRPRSSRICSAHHLLRETSSSLGPSGRPASVPAFPCSPCTRRFASPSGTGRHKKRSAPA